MSERTTIGGTVYESIGSSSSNLLLKCNGTARIQWGSKLIDLIKNGKIASGESSEQLFIISDKSEITSDGIYVLNTDKSSYLLINKDGKQYDLTTTDLYISASNKQDFTAEQRIQALENIGMYFNTLDDVKSTGIQNGIVYVIEDGNLYTIKNGYISEFEAKLKTVTVEKEEEQGENINSNIQIILSVLDEEYIILKDRRITLNQDVHVKEHAQLGSENADQNKGYRLYIDGNTSKLDVDEINVRNGIPSLEYTEVTFEKLDLLITNSELKPNQWYLISDYQSPWKLIVTAESFNRPILVKARTNSTLCEEGMLFNDQTVTLHYDPSYKEKVIQFNGDEIFTRGRITWMRDGDNNEANFDFLDYRNFKGEHIAPLHIRENDSFDKSIFPRGSYNNKLIVYDLKGTVLKDGVFDDTNTNTVEFQVKDDESIIMEMHDNIIECRGLITGPNCTLFYGNTIKEACKVKVNIYFTNNNFTNVYTTHDNSIIESFKDVEDNNIFTTTEINTVIQNTILKGFINSTVTSMCNNSSFGVISQSTINSAIHNSTFGNISNCTFNSNSTYRIENVQFNNLSDCVFNPGNLKYITCHSDISNYEFSEVKNTLLYDTSKVKDVYYFNNEVLVLCSAEQRFTRGMIVMHSGFETPPIGWAICDGGSYTYNGVTSQTPDLRNRFIKAVSTQKEVKAVNNLNARNEFQLQEKHLPSHSHPHQSHTHSISGLSADVYDSGTLRFTFKPVETSISSSSSSVVTSVSGEGITTDHIDAVTSVSSSTKQGSAVSVTGGDHDHSVSITGGTISSTTSNEKTKTWTNEPIKIEPNYYSLIFIMKL
jgi:hypothetical protein